MTEEGRDEQREKQESRLEKEKQGKTKDCDNLDQIVKPKRGRGQWARVKTCKDDKVKNRE